MCVVCVYTRRSNLKRDIKWVRMNGIERERANDREQTRNIKNENTHSWARAGAHTLTHWEFGVFVCFFFVVVVVVVVLPSFFPIPFHSLFYYLLCFIAAFHEHMFFRVVNIDAHSHSALFGSFQPPALQCACMCECECVCLHIFIRICSLIHWLGLTLSLSLFLFSLNTHILYHIKIIVFLYAFKSAHSI